MIGVKQFHYLLSSLILLIMSLHQILVIKANLTSSLSLGIARDCFDMALLTIHCSFFFFDPSSLEVQLKSTQDENVAGCIPVDGFRGLLCGLRLSFAVQVWRDNLVQRTRPHNLEENSTNKYHTTVSKSKTLNELTKAVLPLKKY